MNTRRLHLRSCIKQCLALTGWALLFSLPIVAVGSIYDLLGFLENLDEGRGPFVGGIGTLSGVVVGVSLGMAYGLVRWINMSRDS